MSKAIYQWAIIGAGPAGIASVGLLLDQGVAPESILWVDPKFQVGDFGQHWGEVSSNTNIAGFRAFLTDIKSFDYAKRPAPFAIDALADDAFTQLKTVTEPLQWISDQLKQQVHCLTDHVSQLRIDNGCWQLKGQQHTLYSHKVILATGSKPKSLTHPNLSEIALSTALKPSELKAAITPADTVAVFGSSHSAMIIIRSLVELGVNKVINFYLSPLRYAIPMDGWTLYDNSGLKGETAKWVRQNVSAQTHPKIERFLANTDNFSQQLSRCNKVIYAIGFQKRTPSIEHIDTEAYDSSCGIIAPGLFGTGICFPKTVIDPNGHVELNVGLKKFMLDIRQVLPIWQQYGL